MGSETMKDDQLKLVIVGDNGKNHSCGSIHPRPDNTISFFFPKRQFFNTVSPADLKLGSTYIHNNTRQRSYSWCIDAFRDDIPRPILPVQLKVCKSTVTLPNVHEDNPGLVSLPIGETSRFERVKCCPMSLHPLRPKPVLLLWQLRYQHPTTVLYLSRQSPH